MNNEARLEKIIEELTCLITSTGVDHPSAGRSVWRLVASNIVGTRVNATRLDEWFGATCPTGPLVDSVLSGATFPVDDVGVVFERTATLRIDKVTKRDAGMYYTPSPLADFSVEQIIATVQESRRRPSDWRIIDLAGGSGVFVSAAIESIAEKLVAEGFNFTKAREFALMNCAYMMDSDPLAVAVARCLLIAKFGTAHTDHEQIEAHILCADAVINGPVRRVVNSPCNPDEWPWGGALQQVIDDGGFDAVIGNPPWGTIKSSIREYATQVEPSLLRVAESDLRSSMMLAYKDDLVDLASKKRSYAARLRASGYKHQGGGDTEFYRYFVEFGESLLRSGGALGLLIPSAFQRAVGASGLRRHLLENGAFQLWFDFINRDGIFAIHKMFRFSLLVWQKEVDRGIKNAAFGLTSIAEARTAISSTGLGMSVGFLREVSPKHLTVPDVRSLAAAELYGRLHREHPPLGDDISGTWSVRFRRELDMTNDARMFLARDRVLREGAVPLPDGSWHHPDSGILRPVFEGRMVHQFDSAAKGYIEGHGRSARWELLGPGSKEIRSRFFITASDAERKGIGNRVRPAFCDITGHANERTVLAALVPASAVCGNKVPTCSFNSDAPTLPILWLAIANSIVVDWLVRRRISTTLNYFHWQELPFPRIDPGCPAATELVDCAAALSSGPGEPWRQSVEERGALRAAIDVRVAQLYGVGLYDAAMMFDDFALLDRGAPAGHSTVTRDTVLAGLADAIGAPGTCLSELGLPAGAGPDSLEERRTWHRLGRAVPYISGEMARVTNRSA